MISTVLVANRGEIAVRIIGSAQGLGLRTVAVFSEADRGAAHVAMADEAVLLGPTPATESYLNVDAVLAAIDRSGADAVHPGYGFLSEDAAFAEQIEAAGVTFIGPTPDQLRMFGDKHQARAAAVAAGVPVFPGTGLLHTLDEAVDQVETLGFPVMLKATGGGGGIGLAVCHNTDDLAAGFARVTALGQRTFGSSGVFAERYVDRARHVEVQLFGDGAGRVVSLGDRDCTLQRRHQKVVEEAPAPGLPDAIRDALHESARRLAASVDYRSAGTVEFVYDADREQASFLEVNARLQVEHPVTEAVTGVDLVEWMVRLAGGDASFLDDHSSGAVPVTGSSMEARVYAEDPAVDFRPSAGTVTQVVLPGGDDVRVDGWVRAGSEITTAYDPLLAKVIVSGPDRHSALDRLSAALADTRIDGIEVNLGLLRAVTELPEFRAATHTTHTLAAVGDPEPRITVVRAGLMTTVQDANGRTGLWQVGVPPSGAMDDRSLRLANRAVGNAENAAGLECTATGPALCFSHSTTICVTGAPARVTVDGSAVSMGTPVPVPAGATVDIGEATAGLRTYVAFAGGIDVPEYLGSRATFTLGQFGGHGGRALRPGDVLRTFPVDHTHPPGTTVALPAFGTTWELRVDVGPHGAPEFFTRQDMETVFSTEYEVHFNSARTGVRLVGPTPQWARKDGGEAGLHPSNIHDTAYSVGALDFTGDTPILLGPDGPSLGGFVCPVTVVRAERWKLGQLRPGDTVRFVAVDRRALGTSSAALPDGVLRITDGDPRVVYRRSGDDNVLVEYGDMVLDLGLRARVHALHTAVEARRLPGVIDLTPGIRSLQVHVDPDVLPIPRLLDVLTEIEAEIPPAAELIVPSREVRLPLSWDDPATREAIERYMAGVRDDAPWCPWNIEFIRRINGLATTDDVFTTVFDAEYLVLGLGDVYLGAPVATPLDPRHRLVTTKYNPARTWTAENSVGIGGAYLCIYGMEGPGGYQFIGRTTQVWNRWTDGAPPWHLRFFDRIRWFPVEPEDLMERRADLAAGRAHLDVTESTFSLADHQRFLADNADSIALFKARQSRAFAAERDRWEASGEFDRAARAAEADVVVPAQVVVPAGGTRVDAPFVANVWKVTVDVGDVVSAGDTVAVLEAMKMEAAMVAPADGIVHDVVVAPGQQVAPGDPLIVLSADRVASAFHAITEVDRPEVWIGLRDQDAVTGDVAAASGPLAGLLLAVKNNVDTVGFPTTAGCPTFASEPASDDAPAVARLKAAGATVVGTTNLDQFATGLVGQRSPYGGVRDARRPAYVSGGSSSGSAVAVALGLVDIAVGTDTAGSGRIPAAFQGIVGIKPTLGVVSTDGVVPACRSWDAVTILARDLGTANDAIAVMAGGEGTRPWPADSPLAAPAAPRVAVPATLPGLSESWEAAFATAVENLRRQGVEVKEIDLDPFLAGARLLYDGGLVAERHAAVGEFVDQHRDAVDPTVGAIIAAAGNVRGSTLVTDLARLQSLRSIALASLDGFDALLVPTAPGHPSIADVAAEPIAVNSWLGTYTNFCNLFDLCAVAVPSGTVVEPDGSVAQFGVSAVARPFHDAVALDVASRLWAPPECVAAPGATAARPLAAPWSTSFIDTALLFVVGAHLPGQPLASELEALGARWMGEEATSAEYRLFALDTTPAKPGLVHVGPGGESIDGGLWQIPTAALGEFLEALPAPMTLGQVTLADGREVVGFSCTAAAAADAEDITVHRGWLAWLSQKRATDG